MRSFDYSRLVEKAWDSDILNLVARIHECKGRYGSGTIFLMQDYGVNLIY